MIGRLVLVLACGLVCGLVSGVAQADDSSTRLRVSYVTSVRQGYVFDAADATKISNFGLLAGKDYGTSARAGGFFPYGIEATIERGWFATLRGTPYKLMLVSPGGVEQKGWDTLLTVGRAFRAPLSETCSFGLDLGVRARRWWIEGGALPSSGHAGFVIAGRLMTGAFEFLAEAGLMAMPLSNPASLGVQRDSSTLRLSAAYSIASEKGRWVPELEFFHTLRDFYGQTLVSGRAGLFIDEISLSAKLGFEFNAN